MNTAGAFLINTIFDMYIFILIMRIILVAIRIDYYNPMSQFVVKLTQGIVTPIRKIIPNYKNLELATVLLVILVEALKFFLLGLLLVGIPNIFGILVLSVADALQFSLNIFFYAIIIQAIFSWVQPGNTQITYILARMTGPLMRPVQRTIPPIGGIDITPIPVMIGLKLLIILVTMPLLSLGQAMAFS